MSSTKSKSKETSDFYQACRNGLIDEVRERLPNMTLEEVDRIEQNGSTALHAATYFGHTEIVKLLLEKGASRSITNGYKAVPYDEAEKEDIKKLFLRPTTTRFSDDGSGRIDWIKCDDAAEVLASEYRFRHSGFGWQSKNIEHRLKHIKAEMSHTEQERISAFINKAQEDSLCLLKAYTCESDFYVKLNRDLASKHFDQGTNFGITYFIDFFYNHPAFEDFSYKGKVYRGMSITQDDLKQYNIGGKVMSKAFMSTSKDKNIADDFIKKNLSYRKKQHGELVKMSALCTYEIVNRRTGLYIAKISEYGHEEEVLIGPYTAFIIKAIRQTTPKYVEIDLRECEIVDKKEQDDDDDDFDDD
ncbi:unnamed protein product [Rotaria sp. Silwood2]|nr:unnamed protein product [Rotaria sp. Silwood2]